MRKGAVTEEGSVSKWVDQCVKQRFVIRKQQKRKVLAGERDTAEKYSGDEDLQLQPCRLTHESQLLSTRMWCLQQVIRVRPPVVIDVGCGTVYPLLHDLRTNWVSGPGASNLAYIGADSRLLDINLRGLTNAFGFQCTFGAEKPFQLGSTPCFVCCEVLEHMSRKESCHLLRHLCVSCAAKGSIIISTPCSDGSEPESWTAEFDRLGHLYYWSWKGIQEFITGYGFSVRSWSSRMLKDTRSIQRVKADCARLYGKGTVRLVEAMVDRYGQRAVKALLSDVNSISRKPTRINLVATKES